MDVTISGAGAGAGWTSLPGDLLLTVFSELHIPDLLRSAAVCASWHAAYRAFRRLRLPSPKQPPCLLFSSDAGAAAIHCPSTGATFRNPSPCDDFRSLAPIGSAEGWIVAADEIGNLRLLNPLTGAHENLPPITAMYNVAAYDYDDDEGGLVYDIDEGVYGDGEPTRVPAREVLDCMYYRAVLSSAPNHAAAGECIVLLIHMPRGELSYARPGDERWTPVTESDGLQHRAWYCDAAYSKSDGLFYVVRQDDSVHARSLAGGEEGARHGARYLVHTPRGDLLNVWRHRANIGLERPHLPSDDDDEEDNDDMSTPSIDWSDPLAELMTTEIKVFMADLDGRKMERMHGLDEHALFLGYNSSLCLPVKDFPRLKPNCAYVTDDSFEFICMFKYNKREVGVWNIESQSLENLEGDGAAPPWLNWPVPIWITPSLL
uniref:DUF295 domain-containing protein n=1 Tax=Leersia perrieri TaxID=77586 RepID=A0A0D9XTT3_9ORYZ